MNRLQKKCFFASAALHLLLFALLLVGTGFLSSSSKRTEDLPLLQVIPTKLIDEAAYGGGLPAPAIAPPPIKRAEPPPSEEPRQEPVVQPPVHDPAPLPQVPEPPRKPAVEKIEKASEPPPKAKPVSKTKNPLDVPIPAAEKITPGKHAVVPDLNPAVRGPKENSRQSKDNDRARTREQARAAQEAWKSGIASSLKALQGSLSNNTTIEPVGTGGEAYANYAQAIKTIYTDAWITPEDVNDERATVQVSVIIARDGRVLSFSILKHSGIPALDRSVRNVLDRVKKLPPFPDGANDLQRTFRLNFNLKSKRTLG